MSPIPDKEDSKEIRLFGEKSIREEAYRQKIIQLEKEIMKLESVLGTQQKKDVEYENAGLPEYSEGLFYEASVSLDEKLKGYHKMLEAKARDISERMDLQAHNLIEHENMRSHVVVTKAALVILSLFTAIALAMSAFSVYTAFKKDNIDIRDPYKRPEHVKRLLQESGFYNNQYTIISLDYYNHAYKGIIELHSRPQGNWALKMIASDVIENFKRVSQDESIELNFIYQGSAYAKVNFSCISGDAHYDFFPTEGRK